MKIKLIHPWWIHLPAAAALIILVIYILTAGPLPAEAPVHFGFGGDANRYGSPWEVFGLIIGLSVLYILISILLDELWARQEKKKTFNWLSLFDDIFVGLLTGISFGYLMFLKSGDAEFVFPLGYMFLFAGPAILLAIFLDMLRPYRPYSTTVPVEESPALKEEINKKIKEQTSFVYWDSQNPLYVTLLSTVLPLVMFILAAVLWFVTTWSAVTTLVVGIVLIIPYGGQRTIVTRDQIIIRWGIVGIRVLRLKTSEITGAEVREFAPLKDFGGYGIRINSEMTAYYLKGNRGVKITRTKGRAVLIGSDRPETLAAVIQGIIAAV
jgi:hypothetical protein